MTKSRNTPSKSARNLILGSIILLSFLATCASAQSKNEKLTVAAFLALETNNFEAAITNALLCIDDFDVRATEEQTELEKNSIPKPPIGKPKTPEVKEETHARGVLNDVATCYYILGEANRELAKSDRSKIATARKAYEGARRLTYARTWDTNGFFWSPAIAASDRLRKLPPSPSKDR